MLETLVALEVMLIVLVEILLMFLHKLDSFVLMFNLFDSILMAFEFKLTMFALMLTMFALILVDNALWVVLSVLNSAVLAFSNWKFLRAKKETLPSALRRVFTFEVLLEIAATFVEIASEFAVI